MTVTSERRHGTKPQGDGKAKVRVPSMRKYQCLYTVTVKGEHNNSVSIIYMQNTTT